MVWTSWESNPGRQGIVGQFIASFEAADMILEDAVAERRIPGGRE